MPAMEWSEKYSVNIAIIDEQHKKFIELLNKLFDAIAADKVPEILPQVIEEAVAYSSYHFATEEGLLIENKYPEYEGHKQEHEDFRAKALQLQRRFEKEEISVGPEAVTLLTNWLDHHIITVDKKYAPFLNAKGIF